MNRGTTILSGGVSNTPLILFQPFNIVVFLSFFSPIIIAFSMVFMSFIFQNLLRILFIKTIKFIPNQT